MITFNINGEVLLLPCPFCGGEARPTAHLDYNWFAPVCTNCGVRGPSVKIARGVDKQAMRELLNKADELWNTRRLEEERTQLINLLRESHKALYMVGCTPENSRRDSAMAEELQERILAAIGGI